MSEPQKDKQTLSRREALKAIAAATGAVTLASLPKKWETPVVEVGALPAHAQTSTTTIVVTNNTGGTLSVELFEGGIPLGTVAFSPALANGASYTFTNLVAGNYTLLPNGPDPCAFPTILTFTPNLFNLAAGTTQAVSATCV